MDPATILAIAQAAATILGQVTEAVNSGKAVLSTNDAAQLKAILDPLHADNMAASAKLDAMLAAVE